MKAFVKVMKALFDPNRIKTVKLLQHKRLSVCELQYALGISQPTVSKYLKILEEAGLVSYKKDGLWVDYHQSEGVESAWSDSLLGNLKHWLNNESEIGELVKKVPQFNRFEICVKN
jgi:ArsR family transcriptional regulator